MGNLSSGKPTALRLVHHSSVMLITIARTARVEFHSSRWRDQLDRSPSGRLALPSRRLARHVVEQRRGGPPCTSPLLEFAGELANDFDFSLSRTGNRRFESALPAETRIKASIFR